VRFDFLTVDLAVGSRLASRFTYFARHAGAGCRVASLIRRELAVRGVTTVADGLVDVELGGVAFDALGSSWVLQVAPVFLGRYRWLGGAVLVAVSKGGAGAACGNLANRKVGVGLVAGVLGLVLLASHITAAVDSAVRIGGALRGAWRALPTVVITLVVVLVALSGARAGSHLALRVKGGVTVLALVGCVVALLVLHRAGGFTELLGVATGGTRLAVDVALLGGGVALDHVGSFARGEGSSTVFAFVFGLVCERRLSVVHTFCSGSAGAADAVPSLSALHTLAPDTRRRTDALLRLTAFETSTVGALRHGWVLVLHGCADAETTGDAKRAGFFGINTVLDVGELVALVLGEEATQTALEGGEDGIKVAQLFFGLAFVKKYGSLAATTHSVLERIRRSTTVRSNTEYNRVSLITVVDGKLRNVHDLAVAGFNFQDAVGLGNSAADNGALRVLDLHSLLIKLEVPFANLEALLDLKTTPYLSDKTRRSRVRALCGTAHVEHAVRGLHTLVGLSIASEGLWGRSRRRNRSGLGSLLLAGRVLATCLFGVFGAAWV